MRPPYFRNVLLLFILLIGCSPRMPVAAPVTPKASKPLPSSIAAPPKQVAMADIPFLSKNKLPRKQEVLIVVDPGHGGDDAGCKSIGSPSYKEKHLNLTTAQFLKTFLEEAGYAVRMTRSDDTFISLDERAGMANRLDPTLFVSVHYNAAPSRDADGVEVFFYRDYKDMGRTKKSTVLAQCILGKVCKQTKAKSRGVKNGNLSVIRQTDMPAVLIEGGFMTNAKEMDKLKDSKYLKKVALGIFQGIQEYLAKENVLDYK